MMNTLWFVTWKVLSSTEKLGCANSSCVIYRREGHRYELRPTILLQPKWLRRFELFVCNCWVPRGSEMISSNSFCGFIFARAIDMNLDPPFFYNPLGKNDENNLIYFLETVTQGSEMISPNSFCGFIFARAIDMNLDPPFLYSRLNKNDRKKILLLWNCVVLQKVLK